MITAYKNGVQMAQVTDASWPSGNPGMGFNLESGSAGCAGTNDQYGFSSYVASDIGGTTPTVTALAVTPATGTLQSGQTQPFTAVATLSDGSTQANPSVTWSATGGTITTAGVYTAGGTAGSYRVIGTSPAGPADTSAVTITAPTVGARTYSTTFPLTENPISDGGQWINGGTVGLDWTNVSTTPGRAIGHQVGASYTDATALLTGAWSPDQRVTATVFAAGALNEECYSEVEMRLRSSISAHSNRGYEVGFKVSQSSVAYLIIVRWNGALGDFTYLANLHAAQYGVKSGDVVSATIVGNVITAYKNGVQMAQVTDASWPSGNPGMGFNLESGSAGCAGTNDQYGFSSYVASDIGGTTPTVTALAVTPATGTLQSGQTQPFTAVATLSDGSTQANPSVTWSATGGTITTAGVYTAGGTAGSYRVIGTSPAGPADTSAVTIAPTTVTVTALVVTPASANLQGSQVQQFTAVATLSNGGTQANPSVTWSATGGTITTAGVYTAGGTAGSFRVIGTSTGGPADTSAVTIASTTVTVTALVVTPASANLLSGPGPAVHRGGHLERREHPSQSERDVERDRRDDHDGGSLHGGSAAGNYRVIGRTSNGRADTSAVTIASTTATVTALVVTPATGTLQSGQTQPFTAVATLSDGSTQANPSVTWSATGGAITTAGVYTAGGVPGTFQVTATLSGGSLAATASIAVTAPGGSRTYSTSFPLTENPISEGGQWINGGTVGLDWTNVSTTPGLAIGLQVGASYTDGTALLAGTWSPNQQATATVFASGVLNEACYSEVELRLHSSFSAHSSRGYKVGFKVSQTSAAYLIITRWGGAYGDYIYLFKAIGAQYGVKNGDVVSARVVGNVITAYKNGVQMAQVTDATFASGSPGMGFNLENAPAGCAGTNAKYGFTSFTATDGIVP